MDMYEAIWKRKSVSHYSMEELDEKLLSNIQTFLTRIPLIEEAIKVDYEVICDLGKAQRDKLELSVVAPYYLVIYEQKDTRYFLNSGYLIGQLSLYLTTKGVASYPVNMAIRKKGKAEKRIIAALAFGKPKTNTFFELGKARRMPLDQLCVYKEEVSPDIKRIIKAARVSPSCMNSQPWRFVVYKNRIHVYLKIERMIVRWFHSEQLIDIGLMLSNLLMEAENLWLTTSIEQIEQLNKKNIKNNIYILSVLID